MKVFAHRGLSSLYPENTLEAFRKALEYDIDGIETDVQLSKDGKLVIIHDELLNRTTNGKGFVKDFTLEELKKLNANNGKDGTYEIPTLEELLNLLKDYDITINLELKTSVFEYPGIEKKVYEEIKKFHLEKRVIISSFNHYSLLRFKEIDPTIKLGVLTADRLIDAEEYVKKHGFDCFHPMFMYCNKTNVRKAHELGLEVNVWTVDLKVAYDLLKEANVDTIMTNCCNLFTKKKE